VAQEAGLSNDIKSYKNQEETLKVDNEVLNVLSNAEKAGSALKLVGQLERSLYSRTNKVLEAAGGKWNRKAQAHMFDGEAADAVDQIILTGQVTVPQDFGYFPTPAPVVARLIEIARIQPGMLVLEPSAGQGAIANEVAKITTVDCIELLPANAAKIATGGNIRTLLNGDFLLQIPQPRYDRVVMNPPFAKQADIHHVNHAFQFLKPDGLLVAVMAAGVLFRDNRLTTDFRALIEKRGGAIEECEEGAFKQSGTMVRTVIVTIPNSTIEAGEIN
jgi:protein-L-isoaspartate O-methyltransferase